MPPLVIKYRQLKWFGHICRMGEMRGLLVTMKERTTHIRPHAQGSPIRNIFGEMGVIENFHFK